MNCYKLLANYRLTCNIQVIKSEFAPKLLQKLTTKEDNTNNILVGRRGLSTEKGGQRDQRE